MYVYEYKHICTAVVYNYTVQYNGGTSGAPLKPLRVDSALILIRNVQEGALNWAPLYAEERQLLEQLVEKPLLVCMYCLVIITICINLIICWCVYFCMAIKRLSYFPSDRVGAHNIFPTL